MGDEFLDLLIRDGPLLGGSPEFCLELVAFMGALGELLGEQRHFAGGLFDGINEVADLAFSVRDLFAKRFDMGVVGRARFLCRAEPFWACKRSEPRIELRDDLVFADVQAGRVARHVWRDRPSSSGNTPVHLPASAVGMA
nr:hypothetical protein [Phytoactinopolyspora limicola]